MFKKLIIGICCVMLIIAGTVAIGIIFYPEWVEAAKTYVYGCREFNVAAGSGGCEDVQSGGNLNDADIIIPVPDTSRTAAEGLSHESGIPVAEGLIKNRYVQRTFIMPRQKERDGAVRIKLNPLKTVLSDKRVLLVDDSIVRGTTLRNIISMVRKSGAKEVHVRVTCPPIISPCFYGIDIAIHNELVACDKKIEEIRKSFNADTLGYQKIDGLVDAIGMPKEDLCLGCLTGEYPTPLAQELSDKLKYRTNRKKTRYWEEE